MLYEDVPAVDWYAPDPLLENWRGHAGLPQFAHLRHADGSTNREAFAVLRGGTIDPYKREEMSMQESNEPAEPEAPAPEEPKPDEGGDQGSA